MSELTAEGRLKELGIELPQPPQPLGAYVEAVQTGNLLFLSGTLPVEAGKAKYMGRVGAELTLEEGAAATRLAALNSLALAREHLGSLDKVTKVVRLSVALVATPDFQAHPRVADGASELLVSIFGRELVIFDAASIGYLDLNLSSDLAGLHALSNAFDKGRSKIPVAEQQSDTQRHAAHVARRETKPSAGRSGLWMETRQSNRVEFRQPIRRR